jgi:hypothetical protein
MAPKPINLELPTKQFLMAGTSEWVPTYWYFYWY